MHMEISGSSDGQRNLVKIIDFFMRQYKCKVCLVARYSYVMNVSLTKVSSELLTFIL